MVFTEGRSSEPDYVNALRKLPQVARNVALTVEIFPEHGVPLTLVRHAVEHIGDAEIDECWCVFDVEWPLNHPNLRSAVQMAQANGISLAVSNPCFELWLVLHHQDYCRFADTSEIESHSRSLDGRRGKSIDAALYMPLREVASRRAEELASRHERNDCRLPHDNPSSGMYKLVRAIEPDDD